MFQKLLRFFVAERCTQAEDLAIETILRTISEIAKGANITCKVETFIYGIAKNVAREERRRRVRGISEADYLPDPVLPFPSAGDPKQDVYHRCLDQCLSE